MSARAAVTSGRVLLYLAAVWKIQGEGEPAGFITSKDIGDLALVHPTQVRRDLSELLGLVGRRGSGYHVAVLEDALLAVVVHGPRDVVHAATRARVQADLMSRTLDTLSGRTKL